MQEFKIKKINTLVVGLLGTFLILFVGLKILYPKNEFDSEKRNKAVTTIDFSAEKKGYLTVDPEFGYSFYSATVEILPENIFSKKESVEVEKGFLVQLYPLGDEIENSDVLRKYIFSDNLDIPNGKLVSTKNAVYVYSRGKWNPFLGPQFFEDLGFDWDRVETFDDDMESSFEEGEKIIAGTPHPDGIILKTRDNSFFLVWDEKLLPIKNEEVIKDVWNDYFAISMDNQKPKIIGGCRQDNSVGFFKCSFAEEYTKGDISGNTFIFSFGEGVKNLTRASIVLNTFNTSSWKNPKITLAFQKARIFEKYGEEIFK